MSATLTINLKDNASPGLQELEDQLAETGQASLDTSQQMRTLSDAEREQITVIHEHKGAWIQLAAALINAGATFISVSGKIRQTAMWTGTLRDIMAGAGRASSNLTGGLASVAARGGTLVRLLPLLAGGAVVVGAGLAATAYGAVKLVGALDAASKKLEQTQHATAEQKKEFAELRKEADALRVSIEEAASRAGVDLERLGVAGAGNIARIKEATADLTGSVARPLRDLVLAYAEVGAEVLGLNRAWQGAVTQAKTWTDNVVENLNSLRKGADDLADFALGPGYSKIAKEQAEWAANLQATEENFQRLRDSHAKFAKDQETAAENRRVAALETTAQIDNEIFKERERAGQLAAQRRLSAEEAEAHYRKLNALEQRRTQIVDAESREQARLAKEAADERLKAEQDAVRRQKEVAEKWLAEQNDLRRRARDFELELSINANAAALNEFSTRLEAEGKDYESAHRARKRLIEQERDERAAAAESEAEFQQAHHDAALRLQREELDYRLATIRRQVDAQKRADEEAIESARKKKEELARLLEVNQAPTGQEILNQVDPRQALAERRAKAAAEAARKRVLDDPRNQQLREEALTNVGASNRLRRMQEQAAKQAAREARIGAFQDVRRGQVDPQELAQAQREAASRMLETSAQNGNISQELAAMFRDQVQTAADVQATQQTILRDLAQLKGPVRLLLANASAARQRAQQGSVQ